MIPRKSNGALLFLFFLLVAALTVWGYSAVTGGATLEEVSVDIVLVEDEPLRPLDPGTSASVCEFTGAFPGTFEVAVSGIIDDKEYPGNRNKLSDSYEVVAGVGENTESSLFDVTVRDGGSKEFSTKIPNVGNDGSIEPGDEVEVTVSIRRDGEVHDSVTRTATVKEREFECS
jgi:hypothetical protein